MSSPISKFSPLKGYCCPKGTMCSSTNGAINAISSMFSKHFESVINLHKEMEDEVPFFAGLNSLNYFATDIGNLISVDKLYRHFLLDFSMFTKFSTMSIPLQKKLAQKIGVSRKKIIEDLGMIIT